MNKLCIGKRRIHCSALRPSEALSARTPSDQQVSVPSPPDDLIAVCGDLLENLGHQVIDLFFKYDYKADQDNDDQYAGDL